VLKPGSIWQRWEPHIHSPGTVFNDQFGGEDAWEPYIAAIEASNPVIKAIGATDYYGTSGYERLVEVKKVGRLPSCDLIFPNVEMRLDIGTSTGAWVNIHLLVSPDKAGHLEELKRFLGRLTFRAHQDTFTCTPEDFIRLGRRSDPTKTSDEAALEYGAQQFKVSFEQLRHEYEESAWAKENILVAVAGGADGSSGLKEGADATLRQQIERFAHIIFASSEAQREFWTGQRAASAQHLKENYDGMKPCLHGSDAHSQDKIGQPTGNRYSWVKGEVAFDTLRQACIDPAGRAFVGEQAPTRSTPSQCIRHLQIIDAPWAQTPSIELNPGLVAIIGPRGSGKTALADIIAVGCDAVDDGRMNNQSFVVRARDLLSSASVGVTWGDDETVHRHLVDNEIEWDLATPQVRYLSQHFVENLCSADGMTDELVREIERVIFEAHSVDERDGTLTFSELLNLKATRFRAARELEQEALVGQCERIGSELEKKELVSALKKQIEEKENLVKRYLADQSKLIAKGSETRVARLQALTAAAEKVRSYLRWFSSQQQALLALTDEVANTRTSWAPEQLRAIEERHKAGDLKPDEWREFLLNYVGSVDEVLKAKTEQAQKDAGRWKGATPTVQSDETPLIADDANLEQQTLSLLEAEVARLGKMVSLDRQAGERFNAITKRVAEENAALVRLRELLADCEQAEQRIPSLAAERDKTYSRIFETLISEEEVLTHLYAPLMKRLASSGETLSQLSFTVTRTADVAAWATEGERLLDLRTGPFRGLGKLQQSAETALSGLWTNGSADEIANALSKFRQDNEVLRDAARVKDQEEGYRAWAKDFAKWMYGTDHVQIEYSVNYDGVDIRKLSPGTRGIVLLLLYLALDDADDRPLIIDQPEENLDPKSIFHELVSLFIKAKDKRQIIMVTHNANLVINTDADQVIVASAGPHAHGALPPITYRSGGLENEVIRREVCEILEGGEEAFRERARRLRVRLRR
jgi:hypothetical protein